MADSLSTIDGSWQMIGAELAGDPAPELMAQQTILELGAGAYAVRFSGEVVDQGTFESGGTLERRTLLMRGTAGPNAGRTIPCLYQLRGDRLRVCYGLNGVAPTDFSTDTQNQRYTATYRRAR